MDGNIITILVALAAILILVKTGSLSKALGFLLKWALYPGLFCILGILVGLCIPGLGSIIGAVVGFILGVIFAIKDANKKMGGN